MGLFQLREAWAKCMDEIKDSLIEYLTLRRSRLTNNSSEPVNTEFSNAQKVGPVKANVMCSDLEDGSGMHFLTLDLDMPVEVLKSSSGNTHLIVKHRLEFKDMVEILRVLEKHGLVQPRWVESTEKHGFSTLRLPGIDKYNENDSFGLNEFGGIETRAEYDEAFAKKRAQDLAIAKEQDKLLEKDTW